MDLPRPNVVSEAAMKQANEDYMRALRRNATERGLEVFHREYEDEQQDVTDAVRRAILAALDHYA